MQKFATCLSARLATSIGELTCVYFPSRRGVPLSTTWRGGEGVLTAVGLMPGLVDVQVHLATNPEEQRAIRRS
jgi:hypothetical protein